MAATYNYGSFFNLNNEAFGAASKQIDAVKTFIEGSRRSAAYLSTGTGGGYFTHALRIQFADNIRYWMKNPSALSGINWAPYNEKYAEWKAAEYGRLGPWYRTGQTAFLVRALSLKKTGQTVGIDPNVSSKRHGFGGKGISGGYKVAEIAQRMEYGYYGGGAKLQARPLFRPATAQFLRDNVPKFVAKAQPAVTNVFSKFLKESIKTSKKSDEDALLDALMGVVDNANQSLCHESIKSETAKVKSILKK